MKDITHYLQHKYRYFSYMLFEDRKALFCRCISCKNTPEYNYLVDLGLDEAGQLDPDSDIFIMKFDYINFIDSRQYVLFCQYQIMKLWNQHNQYINRVLKKFYKKRNELKRRAYKDLLLNTKLFCPDLCGVIVDFLL